jgi:hypothetical protein
MTAQDSRQLLRQGATIRFPDRCLQCGRFVGRYPVGFCCDTHCKTCICSNCQEDS